DVAERAGVSIKTVSNVVNNYQHVIGGTGGQRGGFGGGGGRGGGMGGETSSELISYLEKHQDGAKWLLAVSNSQSAGQLILSTHKPVISMYGFTGTDKGMTVAKLKELVKKGELHYIQVGGSGMGGGMGGGNSVSAAVTAWVQKNATAVKESAYSKTTTSESSAATNAGTNSGTNSESENGPSAQSTSTLYRLDPSDVG
ncbi:LacI family DNA-binding transcriptional regulator, partial [Streptomyces avermitilis]|uniref:LacI family DNA-binding transcriptional regulator n=1 Tax=Streptomyces avermitilis TaxID=33903 RepID=UPI0033FABCC5